MSSYKSYTSSRTTESTVPSSTDKLREKTEKLQELFPTWSHEDLQSVLAETAGDVELAVTRISEGHAEQWGSVTRKKEKKNSPPSLPSSSFSTRGDRERATGDSRGGRGGRGMRGRTGGGRGASRAPAQHRDAGASVAGANGTSHAGTASNEWATDASPVTLANDWDSEQKSNRAGTGDIRGPKTTDSNEPVRDGWTESTPKDTVAITSTAPGQGAETVSETATAPWTTNTSTPEVWGSTSAQNGISEHVKAKAPAKSSKVPAGAKLSWAQIARAQEKTKPPSAPLPSQSTTQSAPPVPSESQPTDIEEEQPPHHDQQPGWEEPTTIQPPTWDDEPSTTQAQSSESQPQGQDGWITAESVPPHPPVQEAWDTSASFSASQESTQDPHWRQTQPEEPTSLPSPQRSTLSNTSLTPSVSVPSGTTSTASTSKPSTPSVTAATARPVNTHRTSARYPKSDQAVVIPAFAGSIGAGGEKLGMQFGSLSIGGEDNLDAPFKSETEQASAQEQPQPPQPSQPPQPPQAQASTQTQPHDAHQSPVVSSSHPQAFFQQQQQPAPSAPAQPQQIHPPAQPSQSAPQQPAPSGPPFGSHQHPQPLSHQQQQQLAQHHQQQQHSYAQQQHGIHVHFDAPPAAQQQQQQPQQQHQQHVSGPQNSSYFRQPESPYYHNPTPPQSAAPEHQGAYATTFSPLGVGAGAHAHAQGLNVGQGQGGHLGGFGAGGPGEYGYGDGQRGFYDYAQPGGFSNRLVHDEPGKGGLPISQSNQPTSSLGSTAGQPQASGGPQGSSGQPSAGQQGQQQSYPAPMPYYYPPYYPQNSYPTYPSPSYGQAYMPKYPVYPHQGPVGPGSGPPPAGKGPSGTAPHSASANQNHLYHGQGAFEDPNAGYQHHQGSTNLGGGDYQKQPPHYQQQQPLYGGQAAQGLQSFLGMQQAASGAQSVSGPGSQQRTNASPETTYKPYGPPGGAEKGGVGIGAQPGQQGRGTSVQQSQQQGAGAGSFYPGGRFSGAGGPQQQGQQQGQGYPQGGDQGQFYPYQPRHQGGYWQ